MDPQTVLAFWFDELTPKQHFVKDAKLDKLIRKRFADAHAAAVAGELYAWRTDADGRLAEIIVLDQFSRNMYRGDPRSFAADPMALVLAQELVGAGLDRDLSVDRKAFAYMPYMHSESAAIHAMALELFGQPGLEYQLKYEHAHREIITRFGRYPHRNAILGRTSTPEEQAFLEQPGSSF